MWVDPLIASSARKHDIADDDMLHAFDHPISVSDLGDGLVMLIGASTVGVIDSSDGPVIVHAMRARPEFLR